MKFRFVLVIEYFDGYKQIQQTDYNRFSLNACESMYGTYIKVAIF